MINGGVKSSHVPTLLVERIRNRLFDPLAKTQEVVYVYFLPKDGMGSPNFSKNSIDMSLKFVV